MFENVSDKYLQSIEDKCNIFYGVLDKDDKLILQHNLYYELSLFSLSDILNRTIDEETYRKIENDFEPQLKITLDYLRPFIENGILKAKVVTFDIKNIEGGHFEYINRKTKEYFSHNINKFIDVVLNLGKNTKTLKDRKRFLEDKFFFTLLDNEWLY